MPRTRVNCPNCRQPVIADVDQLFDVGTDPTAKQKVLSGFINMIQCPNCGYQGSLATPIVYHDPQKELLLTYFPPEMGTPVNEQERIIGPLITRVTNSLPQEKRKAYLLRPQTMLTIQSLVERILEADGITREMIQAQQERLSLIQRLMNTSDDQIADIAGQNDTLIDAEFFNLLSRLIEASSVGGDAESAQRLGELQRNLLPITTFGRQIQEQTQEVEAAVHSLQEIGQELTREKLLDLIIKAPNETQLSVLVSMTRQGMDYPFFQLLSDRIDRARGEGRTRLIELRELLLEMTSQIDKHNEARVAQAGRLLDAMLESVNIRDAVMQSLPMIDEFFVQALEDGLDTARKQGDLEKIAKLKEIDKVLQEVSAPPPEIALIEEMLAAPDERSLQDLVNTHKKEITQEFLDILSSLVARSQSGEPPELAERLEILYRMALRVSMEANL